MKQEMACMKLGNVSVGSADAAGVVDARNMYGVDPLMVRRIVGERGQTAAFSFRFRSVER